MNETQRREQWAVRTVVAAMAVAVVGAVLFVVVFARGADVQWLGIGLALALGGIGYGLNVWAHRLMPQGEASEPREPMRDPERPAAVETFDRGLQAVGRRRLLGGALATALGATGLAALVPLRALGPNPGDALRRTEYSLVPRPRLVDDAGRAVHRDDLPVGGFVTVYPEGHAGAASAQTMLLRLADGVELRPPTRADWVVAGHIAYSRICTHAGCPVGEYQVEFDSLLCPCHQSEFLVTEGARPTLGPAVRPLPQLPLGLDDDDYLIALGDYPAAVGPGWWTRP